jgi:hypothetical protein
MHKTTHKIKKTQKPIDFELHLKYSCPECSQEHWIRYIQAATKNFKVVCDCGGYFRVKTVENFKLQYVKSNKKNSVVARDSVPVDLEQQCVKILTGYGLEKDESKVLINKAYAKYKPDTVVALVKHSLELMRDNL